MIGVTLFGLALTPVFYVTIRNLEIAVRRRPARARATVPAPGPPAS